ncbi:hypothetical protein OG21DRAFT_1504383 [Imleria badia]|nr:hypothetical protein OG21DRAFT_1504383 [Imleria badia]
MILHACFVEVCSEYTQRGTRKYVEHAQTRPWSQNLGGKTPVVRHKTGRWRNCHLEKALVDKYCSCGVDNLVDKFGL